MRSPSLKGHYAVFLHIKVLKNILNMRRTHWSRPRRSSERTNLTRWKRQGYVNFQCFKNESLHYKMVCGFTKKIMFCGWTGFFFFSMYKFDRCESGEWIILRIKGPDVKASAHATTSHKPFQTWIAILNLLKQECQSYLAHWTALDNVKEDF